MPTTATTATIATDKGDIVIDLHVAAAPKAAANFVKLAKQGFYDGVIFHRVIPGFVIQGGDGEFGRLEQNGKLRNPGRVGPNTNGSQFFICHADLRGKLPKNYTIFGTVLSGMDVVDTIATAPTGRNDFPVEPVAMRSVTIAES
jgi:cyclophilin family peptidyl-prolyl cis-trans isomerase